MDEYDERELLETVAFLMKSNHYNSQMILQLSDIILELEQQLLEVIKLQEIVIRKSK